MKFSEWWKIINGGEDDGFIKAKLTKSEIVQVQNTIAHLQKKGLPSSRIISALQKQNSKLSERWKAERAYWTEVKRDDTDIIGDAGEDLGIKKYRVLLSPHACKICIQKTENGQKIFKNSDIEKSGFGHVPPFHPNCYCIIIPTV